MCKISAHIRIKGNEETVKAEKSNGHARNDHNNLTQITWSWKGLDTSND